MTKEEKINRLVEHWVQGMDLSALEDFYIYTKTLELEKWNEAELNECLQEIEQ